MAQLNAKEYRKELADIFAKVLEEQELDWKKEWKGLTSHPLNAARGNKYKGLNAFRLMLTMLERGYEDPRWATFNQIQKMGYRLKDAKGMGVPVEYWFPYDREEKRAITWAEFKQTGERFGERYYLKARYSVVFNAKHIEGLPAREIPQSNPIVIDELVNTLSKNMEVEIINDGGDRAFYRPSEDKIHLPEAQAFNSDYAYNTTALHELAHATGAAHRLNRNIHNFFGSEEYAYEELIAEITSCFMSFSLDMEQNDYHVENHKAYVQSWAKTIREKPELLTKAIAEAEKAASYMEYKAELIQSFEYEQTLESSLEVEEAIIEQEKIIQKEDVTNTVDEIPDLEADIKKLQEMTERLEESFNTLTDSLGIAMPNFGTQKIDKTVTQDVLDLEDYLAKKGVSSPFGPYQDDKLIGHTNVLKQASTKKDYRETSEDYWERRAQSREEYNRMVESGQVRPLTEIERTIRTANGHPDNAATQATRRMAEKRGYDWRTGNPLQNSKEKQMKSPKL